MNNPINYQIENANELEFAIFCIENIAANLGKKAEAVYSALTEKSDILNNYIVANYDILHTQDKQYIVDDILAVMEREGVEV